MSNEQPTIEEMLAYTRGELRSERAERVREYLAANPDMARALTEPFPADDAKPGDLGYLSKEELEKQWARLQKDVHNGAPTGANVVPLPSVTSWRRATIALAAALALAFVGLAWQTQSAMRFAREARLPVLAEEGIPIYPLEGQRGPGDEEPATLTPADDKAYALALESSGMAGRHNDYRIEMVDVGTGRTMWRRDRIAVTGDRITIVVKQDFLKPGRYEFRLYGVDGDRAEPLETYPLRVR